jgi:hypothetical protein
LEKKKKKKKNNSWSGEKDQKSVQQFKTQTDGNPSKAFLIILHIRRVKLFTVNVLLYVVAILWTSENLLKCLLSFRNINVPYKLSVSELLS